MAPTHKQKRYLLKFLDESIRRHPNRPVIFSEGDSWFSFPIHANVIDFLDEMAGRRISLLRLEKNGDKALTMIHGRQKAKLADYMERYQPQALLFSGGGNDVVGADLRPLLRPKLQGMAWRDCIFDAQLDLRMTQLECAYRELVLLRDQAAPNCHIYTHGYDYAVPDGRKAKLWGIRVGPWMEQYLEEKDIIDPDDQRRIIRFLIDRFNQMVIDVESLSSKFTVVRTRRTLAHPQDWNDELHPSRDGFERIAEKFRAKLRAQFPGTF